ncbi:TolC family protein [Rhizorhapis sp. SPR117]|uniref:TolC family protein n=1 Tax=Rhizorhapis sp. SPR117 TaxID=2912611 RepID=UPI001F02E88C|nr:TolC family protein [Rhizorhapis sp. SPR117]
MTVSNTMKWLMAVPGALILSVTGAGAETVDLKTAVQAAVDSHPEINQAIMNKEAIEFERDQAQGLFLPRISVEGSAGVRRLENSTRRAIGIEDQTLYPLEASVLGEQVLFDSGARSAELKRQAARTDGAALRVGERSEFIALNVARQYLDYMLQQRVVAAAQDNVTFHDLLVGDLREGVSKGSISIADQQQAEERFQAAKIRMTEAQEDLTNAAISFTTLTGISISDVVMPESLQAALPPTLGDAVAVVRERNPKVREAQADVDAAYQVVNAAKADLGPTVSLEGRGRVGEDVDGFKGSTNDVQARVVLRWQLFDGGINRAKVQEMTRRASEARFRLHQLTREAEEEVRQAWNRKQSEGLRLTDLEQQSRVSDDLLLSYREQFNVGRRSLLDVLDSQNTRFNVQVRTETSRLAQMFAEYQILAATDQLLSALGVTAPTGSNAYARDRFDVPDTEAAELMRRRYPR